MPESHAARGARRGRRALVSLGEEIRAARLAAGLTQLDAATAAGMSDSRWSRIEHAQSTSLSIVEAARACAIVGLDLSVRSFAGPDAVRDAAHVRLLRAFQGVLGSSLAVRVEVPVGDRRDQRAWDMAVSDGSGWVAVELETRITDVQALSRRVSLKARDGGIGVVVLVVLDTRSNRDAVYAGRDALRPLFPLDPGAILGGLRAGRLPPAGGLVFLRPSDRVR